MAVGHDDKASRAAREFFEGAFAYYRNHAVHVGLGIDEGVCIRALIVASELLDLLQASEIHFSSLGELQALAKARGFSGVDSLRQLLNFLDGYVVVDLCIDGLFEELAKHGWGDEEYKFVFEVGLMEFESGPTSPEQQEDAGIQEIGEFRLTAQGARIVGNEVSP